MLLKTQPMLNPIAIAQSLNRTTNELEKTFKRREFIPLHDETIWLIKSGFVRTFTLTDDGNVVPLGLWGAREAIGRLFTRAEPYQVECLTNVKVVSLKVDECYNLDLIMLSHIHQMQELIQVRSGQIQQRLFSLLAWLVIKFGRPTDFGHLIPVRLTHQDIADLLGTTRVTVTRKLQEMEQNGLIRWSKYRHHLLMIPNSEVRTPVRPDAKLKQSLEILGHAI